MLDITERLYGISFSPAAVPLCHEDVMFYERRRCRYGRAHRRIFSDLYPRAAVQECRPRGRFAACRASCRRRSAVLRTISTRVGLTHSELENADARSSRLHGVLSQTEYNQHSGTSVEREFVEAPSQRYEEGASRMESLVLMRNHCTTCPMIDSRS